MAALARLLILAGLAALLCPAPAAAQTDALAAAAAKLAQRMEKHGWKRVVVGDFLAPEHARTRLGETWREQTRAALAAHGAFELLPADRWAELGRENHLGLRVLNEPKGASWVADVAGADAVVLGRLQPKRDRIELLLEAVDARDSGRTAREKARLARTPEADALLAERLPEPRADPPQPAGAKPGQGGVGYPACDYCPDPRYPPVARAVRYQGRVVLMVIVTPEGRATNIRVLEGAPYGLTEEAIKAVRQWRFKPALGPGGVPVAVYVPIEVTFRLLD